MEKVKTLNDNVTIDDFGGKAYWLSWLHKSGYKVPHAVFIRGLDNNQKLDNELEAIFTENQ